MMGVAVKDKVSAVSIDNLNQARCAEVAEDLRTFADDSILHGRVMQDDHALGRAKVRHSAFEFQPFIDSRLYKCLDLRFAESSERGSAKAANKTLGAGEAYSIMFVAGSVQHFDSGRVE